MMLNTSNYVFRNFWGGHVSIP